MNYWLVIVKESCARLPPCDRCNCAAVRLAGKKPQAFALMKCVAALADDIGHRPASHDIDLELCVLVGLQPGNAARGIREKKKPTVFSAKSEVFVFLSSQGMIRAAAIFTGVEQRLEKTKLLHGWISGFINGVSGPNG